MLLAKTHPSMLTRYLLVDRVRLWARLSLCPLGAPSALEGPVAPEARVVQPALDLPVWEKNKHISSIINVILLDLLRAEQLHDNEDGVAE